eukprot:7803038-Pyramimonas_sp.AAC.1
MPASFLKSSCCKGGSTRSFFCGGASAPSASLPAGADWVSPPTPCAGALCAADPAAPLGGSAATWDAGMGSFGTFSMQGASTACSATKSTSLPSKRSFKPWQSLRLPILRVILIICCWVSSAWMNISHVGNVRVSVSTWHGAR